MMTDMIHPPYIWFGGKRSVAPAVWAALGDVDNYVEPFFGGGSVWLLRPHTARLETVNDMDGFVSNFWRSVQAEPDAVAEGINWPVNEVDLEARHRALCRMPEKAEFLERMKREPGYYDVERAAWWCWGLCAWIGSGWCGGEYWPDETGRSKGRGVHRQLPHLGNGGLGVHRQLPHLLNAGLGVHRKLPHLGDAGRGECARRGEVLREWMQALADRLRNVRVCCGDWARICTRGATAHGRTVGVFLGPPYSGEAGRYNALYREEDLSVAHRVREWCIERQHDEGRWSCAAGGRVRIVLCGYEGEHDELEGMGWRVQAWKAKGGFANFGSEKAGKANAKRERIWYSPSCLGEADLPLLAEHGQLSGQ